MKKLVTALLVLSFFTLSVGAQEGKLYGKKFNSQSAISVQELQDEMGDKDEMPVVVSGVIEEVCQVAGCWIRLQNEDGESLFVKIKDHEFAVPKDMSGHKAIVIGTAMKKTVSVEELQHYAEDGGKSEEEIAAITEPKTEIRISATAMVIE